MPNRSRAVAKSVAFPSSPEPLFLRVDIVLRGAPLFIIVGDATHLPPPYRLENRSPVALFYQQAVSAEPQPPRVQATSGNGRWSGGAAQSSLPPHSRISYAPEEPLLPLMLSVGVQGGSTCVYDLTTPGPGPRLVYDNCVYVAVCGVTGDNSSSAL